MFLLFYFLTKPCFNGRSSFAFQSYRKIARQVSTPDSAPAGLGSPQAGIGGLQQHQQQSQQQAQQTLHQPDPMQQSKDNLNPAANQQTGALRNGNPPPPVVSMVSRSSASSSTFHRIPATIPCVPIAVKRSPIFLLGQLLLQETVFSVASFIYKQAYENRVYRKLTSAVLDSKNFLLENWKNLLLEKN